MACVLTTGRQEPCKDSIGGIKTVYACDYLASSFTVAAGVATAMNVSLTVAYQYDLKSDTNTYNEDPTSDNETGTTTYAQSLVLHLKKQTQASAAEIHLLLKARPIWVILDRNDNYRVMGLTDGTDGTGTIPTGGAKTEFNGYDLTFTATETEPAPYLDSATETAFLAVVSGTQITP